MYLSYPVPDTPVFCHHKAPKDDTDTLESLGGNRGLSLMTEFSLHPPAEGNEISYISYQLHETELIFISPKQSCEKLCPEVGGLICGPDHPQRGK